MDKGLVESFANDDRVLREKAKAVSEARREAGLEGLTGGLEAVVVNVEPQNLSAAVLGFLGTTGYAFREAFEDSSGITCLLSLKGSADFLFRTRAKGGNPFLPYSAGPKSAQVPNTRLETFVYSCRDLREYVRIQKERGVAFMTGEIEEAPGYLFIQTEPSRYTGNSLGFIEWKGKGRNYRRPGSREFPLAFEKPNWAHLKNIGFLDHSATRVRAEERDAAILEFMELTGYDFKFSIYVKSLNSITNVTRLTKDDYAQVFTSGIRPFVSFEESGPTEKFIRNYGLRVHHLAFATENIEATFDALKAHGMDFLLELVGSPEEGLKQTFSATDPNTLLVHEYIHRYGDFDGFFARSNVIELTRATDKQ